MLAVPTGPGPGQVSLNIDQILEQGLMDLAPVPARAVLVVQARLQGQV